MLRVRDLRSEPKEPNLASAVAARMRAAVYREKGRVVVEDRPVPAPASGEVLLRISHCGVCGTDLHLMLEGWGPANHIGGHEWSGRIVALGDGVHGWQPGDAVVGGPIAGCGACEACLAHRPSLCARTGSAGVGDFQGAFAQYMRVPASQLRRVPDGLSLREAALAEPLAVALHGITLSSIAPGRRALVSGAGPIGMLTLAALRARGITDVTVSEPAPVRRALAARVGASRVLAPDALSIPRMPFEFVPEGFHAAFECSGRPEAVEAALAQLVRGGTLVLVGTGMKRPRLDANRVILGELTVTGSYNYDENGFDDALELLASGKLPTSLLLEQGDVDLEGLLSAMQRLAAGEIGGKVLVAPS
jgi:(R,R)-butanediol dehydrogenase/meso-butanediol dehydrogenase/diacetyl reductase